MADGLSKRRRFTFAPWMFLLGVVVALLVGYACWVFYGPVIGTILGVIFGGLATLAFAERRAG